MRSARTTSAPAAVSSSVLQGPVATGLPGASHAGWWLMVGAGVLLAGLAVVVTTPGARRSSERVAAALG